MSSAPETADSTPRGAGRPSPRPFRPFALRPTVVWAGISATLTAAAGAGLLVHGARGAIGAAVASGWLAEQGVRSSFRVESLDATGFTGAIALGDPKRPDLVSEHVELRFTPDLRLRSLRAVEPIVRARFDGLRLSFGSLQGLIDKALSGPPSGAPKPDIRVERGVLLLATPGGGLRGVADAHLDARGLETLDARLLSATLVRGDDRLALTDARLSAKGVPGGKKAHFVVHGSGRLQRNRLERAELSLNMDASGSGLIPDGPARLAGSLRADAGFLRGIGLTAPDIGFDVKGAATGPLERLSLSGQGHVTVAARTLRGGGARASAPRLSLGSTDLHLARNGDRWRMQGLLRLKTSAAALDRGADHAGGLAWTAALARLDARLEGGAVTMAATGESSARADRLDIAGFATRDSTGHARGAVRLATGGAAFDGALGLATSPGAAQARRWAQAAGPLQQPLSRALTRVSISARSVRLRRSGTGAILLSAGQPIRALGSGGALIALTPRGGPLLQTTTDGAVAGAGDLAVSGGGLPRIQVAAARYSLGHDRGGAAGAIEGGLTFRGDLGEARGLALDASGAVQRREGVLTARLAHCTPVSLQRYASLLRDAAGELCPGKGETLRAGNGRWAVDFALKNAKGVLAPARLALAGSAAVQADNARGAAQGLLNLTRLELRDLDPKTRFKPLALAGPIRLTDAGWRGRLEPTLIDGPALGLLTVAAAADASSGEVLIETGELRFASKGLQPSSLSPLAPSWISQVDGPAHFTGAVRWGAGGLKSEGALQTAGLDFTSPGGRLSKARGQLAFDSLLPLSTPPGQEIAAEGLGAVIPLGAPRVRFRLRPDRLDVEAAQATLSGGQISLDPMAVSFDKAAVIQGTAHLAGVDVGQLIAASNLADKVKLQARVSGAIPFALGPEGVRFREGRLQADAPGRLSISREALAGGKAETTGVQDVAYQALENLAFQKLDATVNSQDKGRLGVLFHINGRHDPPTLKEARVPLSQLISGKITQPLDLPSGTPVNLTLDSSLNFDELLAAYRQAGAKRSEAVQARGAS